MTMRWILGLIDVSKSSSYTGAVADHRAKLKFIESIQIVPVVVEHLLVAQWMAEGCNSLVQQNIKYFLSKAAIDTK
jgi:hypothetical protein